MIPVPSEGELKRYLIGSSDFTRLPPYAELEPGSFLYYVNAIWAKEQSRDGRRGHLSDSDIADKISEIIGKKFTRNQFQSLFGAGRKEQKQKGIVPRDVAEAFLAVAFTHWSCEEHDEEGVSEITYTTILPHHDIDFKQLVNEIGFRMYSAGLPVRCAPATGIGPIGFYRQCRKENSSVIVATEREHIVMKDPGEGLFDWMENIRTYFRDIDKFQSGIKHIWVVKEPVISDDFRALSSIHDFGLLRTVFMSARAMCMSRKRFPVWEEVSQRSIVVMLLNKNNNKYRVEKVSLDTSMENPIDEYFIFPNEVPSVWKSQEENISVSDLNFITTVKEADKQELKVDYNIFLHKEESLTAPVVKKSSPGKDSDRSFRNLYKACCDYQKFREGSVPSETLLAAQKHGWRFLLADEFLGLLIP